ncbi:MULTISPECIES: oxygenase MpaB family protein [unclassified Rhodococcus (in: high G+C Gram-positive bacteria)]|uniref:oxygenase MpaB family protein n=1 Tax=unclassified Rhodococcus (in: high G+C Gram-positive bacteria) TaxID=192944 RepID=UPI0015C5D68B|nr:MULTISPECIES: oxygenase MpaB family protein [unclassified Rhodococcus (in: high G+C Gram-positive bacteria)]
MTWKVMEDPAVFFIGLLREALLLTLHPDFAAAAVDHDSFADDPMLRFQHVAMYTYGATYGTVEEAARYSAMVNRTHTRIVGMEPMTGNPYQAHAEYELALTQVMLVDSFREAYEALYGELSAVDRDQFVLEQQVPAAMLGVQPDHMPSTFGQMVDFLAHARVKFASGLQARAILEPFASGSYSRGTAIGDLPTHLRLPAMFGLRAMADIAISIMTPEERTLISIGRRPKLGSKTAVKLSYRALSAFVRSTRGTQLFSSFVKPNVAGIIETARIAQHAPGARTRAAQFVVPNAYAVLWVPPVLVPNWPGSTAAYRLGDRTVAKVSTHASNIS